MLDYDDLSNVTKSWYFKSDFKPSRFIRHRILSELIRRHGTGKKDVLEIGFGDAELIHILIGFGIESYHGIDISRIAVRRARLSIRNRKATFSVMDAAEMRFRERFSMVIALDVLEHVKDDERVIRNIHDSLKPGGVAIINVPIHMRYWNEEDVLYGHFRRYEPEELISRFASHGFEVMGHRFSEGFFFKALQLYRRAFRIKGTSQEGGIKRSSLARHLNALNRPLCFLDKQYSRVFNDGAAMFIAFRKP